MDAYTKADLVEGKLYNQNAFKRMFVAVIIEITQHLKPDDVFDKDDLDKWATENGYVKES